MNTEEPLPEILTLRETAEYFRCSERHIQNLVARGLPHMKLGALLRFRKEDVLAFLASNQRLSKHKQRQQMRRAVAP